MRIGLLAGAVGLAIGLPAFAQESRNDSKTDFRLYNADGTPVTPEYLSSGGKGPNMSGSSVQDLSGQFSKISRGGSSVDSVPGTLTSGFESFAVLPANLVNQNDTVTWGGAAAGVTGTSRMSATSGGFTVGQYGVVTELVAGNATKKIRGLVLVAAGAPGVPSSAFGRFANYNFTKINVPVTGAISVRYVFAPDTLFPMRMVHDSYVTAISSLWTSEPSYVSAGFIVGRLLWGGENSTTGVGLPIGPIPDFYTLGNDPNSFLTGIFVPCTNPTNYRGGDVFNGTGAGTSGGLAGVPIGAWFKVAHETTVAGHLLHFIDRNNGHGEYLITDIDAIIAAGRADRVAWSGDRAILNDAFYVDNLSVSGAEFVLPIPPTLKCASGTYVDNQSWMAIGGILGQGTRVTDFLSSRGEVLGVGDGRNPFATQAIYRTNVNNDDRYRVEIQTGLPFTAASGVGPLAVCVPVRLNTGPFGYATVQAITPTSVTDGDQMARLLIGRYTPTSPYTSRMYVQTNDDYIPIDNEDTTDPYAAGPGPFGEGRPYVVGTDVADTGTNWTFNSNRTVCFNVNADRTMTVTVAAATVFTGSAFVASVDQMRYESENNQPGNGDAIVYDDITVTCAVLPSVTPPALTLVYNDNLEWALENVTIGLQDDDATAATPFRWGSAGNRPTVTVFGSRQVKAQNTAHDTASALPNVPFNPGSPPAVPSSGFAIFGQANTGLPTVTASATRGWVARSDNRMNNDLTSRTWTVAQATIDPNIFASVAGLTFSSVSKTFWYQIMDVANPPDATTWADTGTTLSGAGIALNASFTLSTNRSLSGKLHFRVGPTGGFLKPLRFTGGVNANQVVLVNPLTSTANGTHKNMDRLFINGSDELDLVGTGAATSILYSDNIRAWSYPCVGDTNNDGLVDFDDLNNVLTNYSQVVGQFVSQLGNIAPDTNNDGIADVEAGNINQVNFDDLNAVLTGYGVGCTGTN